MRYTILEVKVWSQLIGSKSYITSINSRLQILNSAARVYPKYQRQKTAVFPTTSLQKLLMSPLSMSLPWKSPPSKSALLSLLSREPPPAVPVKYLLRNPTTLFSETIR